MPAHGAAALCSSQLSICEALYAISPPSSTPRSPKIKNPRFHSPPTVAPKSRSNLLEVSRALHTDVSRRSWPESRWYKWATKHTYISRTLVLFICGGITFCFVGGKRVPITGRNQLEYVPKWVEKWFEKEMHNETEEKRKRTADCSWRAGDPGMQVPIAILNRLLRASGLEDSEWELRIVNAPCKSNPLPSLYVCLSAWSVCLQHIEMSGI